MRKVYCPVNGWDCPYYKDGGLCTIENPLEDCEDFGFFWGEDEEYWVDEDED